MILIRAAIAATALIFAPLEGAAQPGKIARVGVLSAESPPAASRDAFRAGLRELGYVEGRNIALEYRWAGGQTSRLPELAAELAGHKVDVIVAFYTTASLAAKGATNTTPIVMAATGDAVKVGLVSSLARPGGNVTGLSALASDLMSKRLGILKEAVPKLSRVAVLLSPANPINSLYWKELQELAPSQGVQVQRVDVRSSDELDPAFAKMSKERAGAVLVLGIADPLFSGQRKRVIELAARHRLPAMYVAREFVEEGGLMTYGPSQPELFRRAAVYVDKILRGAKPGDLPVEQPTKFERVINLKTAKALGLAVPPSLLRTADQLIE